MNTREVLLCITLFSHNALLQLALAYDSAVYAGQYGEAKCTYKQLLTIYLLPRQWEFFTGTHVHIVLLGFSFTNQRQTKCESKNATL